MTLMPMEMTSPPEDSGVRFERVSDVDLRSSFGMPDHQVDVFTDTCKREPGVYFILSRHASQSAASSRIAQMKKTRRWRDTGLHFKSRRIEEEDHKGAIIACWPGGVKEGSVEYIDGVWLNQPENKDHLRSLLTAIQDKKLWLIPEGVKYVDEEGPLDTD